MRRSRSGSHLSDQCRACDWRLEFLHENGDFYDYRHYPEGAEPTNERLRFHGANSLVLNEFTGTV